MRDAPVAQQTDLGCRSPSRTHSRRCATGQVALRAHVCHCHFAVSTHVFFAKAFYVLQP